MAQQKSVDPIASHKIAEAREIPVRFLLKVLKPLATENLLKSIKGPHGGYKLARPANQISILEIIEAVDGKIRGQTSWTEKNSPALNTKLESICSQSAEATRKTLEKFYVSDLVTPKKEAEEKPARRKAKGA